MLQADTVSFFSASVWAAMSRAASVDIRNRWVVQPATLSDALRIGYSSTNGHPKMATRLFVFIRQGMLPAWPEAQQANPK